MAHFRWIVRIIFFSIVLAPAARAADIMIFDVRRPLALSDKETTYKDFYISGGNESGLRAGMIVNVMRKIPLYDSYQNRSAGELMIKVARVKLVAVQKGLSVARLHSDFSRDNNPILEDNYIMVGDLLDLASATSEKSVALEQGAGEGPTDEPKPEAPASQAQPIESHETIPSSASLESSGPQVWVNLVAQ